jgi:hypothetical protein
LDKVSAKSFNVDIKTPFQQFKALSLRGKLEKQNMIYDRFTKDKRRCSKFSIPVARIAVPSISIGEMYRRWTSELATCSQYL